jgi:UDP-N-acetylglucosamine--dolichyl-phosphate N-acetylglucosaminephosphotransferase
VFLSVVVLAGAVGAYDDRKTLGPKIKPVLTAMASFPILVTSWVIGLYALPLPLSYWPYPSLPFVGPTQLTIVYQLIIPFAIAVPANAVNMLDVFNGVMPLTTILMFAAIFVVSIILMVFMIPGAELGLLLACVMVGALLAYYCFNRNPARVFAGDTGSLSVGAALGALAVIGRIEIVAIVALLPAIMNAFYSLVSVRGLLERRQMRKRPTIFQKDGTLAATLDKDAPMTLTRLVLARGPLTEQQITLSLAVLALTSSVLAVITILLIPFRPLGFLVDLPLSLLLILLVLLSVVFLVFVVLRNKNKLGSRLTGLIIIMIGVWLGGMAGFFVLDLFIIFPPPPGMEMIFAILRPLTGIGLAFGWLALWLVSTRLYFRYSLSQASASV